jgi:glycosyltransferase involved in cell wall biosynthesis
MNKINVLYHTSTYNSKFSRWDAVGQEIKLLSDNFGGKIFAFGPQNRWTSQLQQLIFKLPAIFEQGYFYQAKRFEDQIDLHHIFYPRLRDFRYLKILKKPIIYSVVSQNMGYSTPKEMIKNAQKMTYIDLFVVATAKDKEALAKAGLKNVQFVLPGIDIQKFYQIQRPKKIKKKLLMASPPTSPNRFWERGIDLVLALLSEIKDLKMTFFWRKVAYEKIVRLVRDKKLNQRVTIINRLINPVRYLAGLDGAIAVFRKTEGNKAYPNSIIESLASGRPVIVSSIMPIAEVIKKYRSGVIVKPNKKSLIKGIGQYYRNYSKLTKNTRQAVRKFSQKRLLADYQKIYQQLIKVKR